VKIWISDHAILRYLERIHNLDMPALKREMLPPEVRITIKKLKTGKVIHNGVRYQFAGYKVLTVKRAGRKQTVSKREDKKAPVLPNRQIMDYNKIPPVSEQNKLNQRINNAKEKRDETKG